MKYNVGDKVTIHAKTAGVPLRESLNYRDAKGSDQEFLYVVGYNDERVCCGFDMQRAGDFFNEEDLTLYLEDTITNNYELF